MAKRGGGTILGMNPLVIAGGVAAFLYLKGQASAVLPNAGSPTEYWLDPTTFALWYEFGGTTTAPQPGMRPASSWEINTYWPPVNHPELGTPSTTVY